MAERVVVAMSGGVDSSVAALRLLEAGFEVIGITLQLYDQRSRGAPLGQVPERSGRACCSLDDTFDARRVAEHIGIPHYVLNHEEEFEDKVVRPYVEEYLKGRTPSPCIGCNTYLKFDILLRRARALGARWLATGHYARIRNDQDGTPRICRAVDPSKDQSYFLMGLSSGTLPWLRFPLGDLDKDHVRRLAEDAGLPVAHKPDSMETCFVGVTGAGTFVEESAARLGIEAPSPGAIVDTDGQRLGTHRGIHHYTVGQRRGLGISAGEPMYVTEVDAARAMLRVGGRAALQRGGLEASGCNWFGTPPAPGRRLMARIRHRHEGAPAIVALATEDRLELDFESPVEAIAPGQAVVLYDDDAIVGGGWIVRARDPSGSSSPSLECADPN